jgi:aspartate aminotransferase
MPFISRSEHLVFIIDHVSAYITAEGEPLVMPFVKKVEQQMARDPKLHHDYLPYLGLDKFNKLAPRLLLGEESRAFVEGRVSD